MNKNVGALGAAIAATLGATDADATTYSAVLKQVVSYSGTLPISGEFGSSTATWSYDDVTGLLSQTGGTFNVRFNIVPGYTLFRHQITGLVIGNGGAATAATFSCKEGNFGTGVGASLCGNYNFGANSWICDNDDPDGWCGPNPVGNESTTTWGPGTAFARTIGGDDMALGLQQSLALYNAFETVSWVGTTLTLSNGVCNPAAPGNASGCATLGGYNSGYRWVLDAGYQGPPIPVPPAVWLFGSALAALGVARQRAKTRG